MIDFILCDDGFVAEFSGDESFEDISNFMSMMNGKDEDSFSFINDGYLDEIRLNPSSNWYNYGY